MYSDHDEMSPLIAAVSAKFQFQYFEILKFKRAINVDDVH